MKIDRILEACLSILVAGMALAVSAQSGGTIRGSVRLPDETPLHNATVRVVQLGRVAETNEEGAYEFTNIPPGTYNVVAAMPSLSGPAQSVSVQAGATATANLTLSISPVRQEVTVTASGREQLTMQAFQTVTSLDSLQLAENPAASLGEALDNQPGVAKRSFGPGSSRPVIRGFDGDRVLVLQDGVASGSLASQSGDHGEPINTSLLERLEVVKGPATLLYGSNAVGGVVNAITPEGTIHEHPHEGLRGSVTGMAGGNNGLGGGGATFDYGVGSWRVFASGGGQRTGNYETADGEVENSETRLSNFAGGFGRYAEGGFMSVAGGYDEGRYGIASEDADIDFRRAGIRFNGGVRNFGAFDAFRASVGYSDWSHQEIEDEAVGTTLNNKLFSYRGVFDQRRSGRYSGSFGASGAFRNFEAIGEEALSPPVDQNTFALFALEEINLNRVRLQFGGRLEHTGYRPENLTDRDFTGLSAGAGAHVSLWENGAFVANFTSSYRAPALEELYFNGPHPGNLAFEIGDENLERERSNGIDLSLRHQAARIRGTANFYYYDIDDFVYLAPTGNVVDDLNEAIYTQADARFVGTEALLDVGLHQNLWLNLGIDAVNAKLKESDSWLPRIPPLRGRVGFDIRYRGLSLRPEALMANARNDVFDTETPTPGYAVFNLRGSYTIARQHQIHLFSVDFFNIGDRVYRNHVSFIKDVAPEIGRGVNFTYTVKFF